MKIEIWSDFACPYCYIGDNRLKSAIKELGIEKSLDITYKTFQLDPNAVRREPCDYAQLLADKYRKPYSDAKEQVDGMVSSGRELGLNFSFDILIRTNTTLAHKVAKYARDLGREREFIDRVFKGYFEKGLDISNLDSLIVLLKEVGVDTTKLREKLSADNYSLEIKEDYKDASSMDVQGVPFFVIDNRYAISGAQSLEYFKAVLNQVKNKDL